MPPEKKDPQKCSQYWRHNRNPVKRTNIYISSDKYVLNRSISMEVRLNGFPLSWWCDNFLFQFLIIFLRIFLTRGIARYRAHSKKLSYTRNTPKSTIIEFTIYHRLNNCYCYCYYYIITDSNVSNNYHITRALVPLWTFGVVKQTLLFSSEMPYIGRRQKAYVLCTSQGQNWPVSHILAVFFLSTTRAI
jgi:hypothetical protein